MLACETKINLEEKVTHFKCAAFFVARKKVTHFKWVTFSCGKTRANPGVPPWVGNKKG